MIEILAGTITLGIDRRTSPFLGWDNEYQQNIIKVPAFAIDSHKVTNGDYLKFVHNGGYEERLFWAGDDWEWVRANGVAHPRFWTRRDGQWFWRGLFNEYALPPDWPVYVSHAEASAYARWAGKSLPTEAQFERAAFGSPAGNERPFPWGDAAPAVAHGNFGFQRWDPVPVGATPEGDSAFGVSQMVGNGWEWTSTVFGPFPGFKPFPFYPGYSANFFDGCHYVIKGGSSRTAAPLLRRSFRNWFRPNYPYVYAGFRLVEN
jgi:formylglycine-generating enzyme required for sulfatase activity